MKRLFKFSALLLLLLMAKLPCKAEVSSKFFKKADPFTQKDQIRSENRNIFFALLTNYNNVQLTRPETQQRSLQFARELFVDSAKYNQQSRELSGSYFTQRTDCIRLRRLIIYPFHAFW